ncbi:MAG: PKD domain-containing protein [Bdellovibrionaceae bacterium]|nr:PKD domain-containing protein [Pseudobdellovibrionaceae bacterium]
MKEIEVLLLRPSAVTVSINNAVIFSKGDYDAKKGIFEKSFVAKKTNVMEVKVQGSFLSNVTLSAKASSANLPPLADFTYSATDYIAPATVNFSGLLSRDQDSGYIAAYEWNFGDGSFGSGSLISHVYSNPGNYNAVLTIIDNAGAKGSKTQVVNIKANQLPVARFNIVPKTALGELRVEVDGSASSDADGTIESYTINWNDGSNEESTADYPRFDHVYAAAGQKQITLKVKDSRGGLGTSTQTVLVQDSTAPILSITSPVANSKIRGEVVSISGASNEMLASVVGSINETEFPLTVSPDGRSFSGSTTVNTEGSKTLQIKGTDNAGNIANVSVSFTIELNKAPLAKLVAPTVVSNGDVATFDASSSKDEDGTIVKYIVNFQDGSNPVEQTSPVFQHSFNQHGYFDVSLQIIDNEGGSATASARVYVNAKPVPTFVATAIGNGLEMQFDASSTLDSNNSDSLSYSWEFGDGATGSGIKITHTYTKIGSYSVKLVVSDGYSTSYITETVIVSNPATNDGEILASPGKLSLKEKYDRKFNKVGDSISVILSGANFGSNSIENSKIWVNGYLTNLSPEIYGNEFVIKNLLIEGLNKIEIDTFDANDLHLKLSTKLWAGNRSLNLDPTLSKGGHPSGDIQISAILPEGQILNLISPDSIIENIPSEKIVFYVRDSQSNSGISIYLKETLSLKFPLVLYPNLNSGSAENNDFTAGLGGWIADGATPTLSSHNEEGIVDLENRDLVASSSNIFKISRTIINPSTTNMNWMRFGIAGYNPNDAYLLVFRGINSNQFKVYYRDLKSFGLRQPSEVLFTSHWIEDTFQLENTGEPVDATIYLLPSSAQQNTAAYQHKKNKYFSFSKNIFTKFFLKFENIFLQNSVAETKAVFAFIDYIGETKGCITRVDMLDNGSPNFFKNDPTDIDNFELNFLSVGGIPTLYHGGKNRIAARLEACSSNSIREWRLEALIGGKKVLLDSQFKDIPITRPNDEPLDVIFFVDSQKLEDLKNSLGNKSVVEIFLYGIDSSFNPSKIPLAHYTLPILVYKNFPEDKYRFGSTPRDRSEGGDDWMAPWMVDLMTDLLEHYNGSIRFNDISNMNGGFFYKHLGHEDGAEVDMNIRNYPLLPVPPGGPNPNAENPVESQVAIERFLEFFDEYGERMENAFLLYSRPLDPNANIPFDPAQKSWNRIRHECVNNRLVRTFLTSAKKHGDHFHVNFSEEKIVTPSPGAIQLSVSVGEGGILGFEPSIFSWQGDTRYEAYFEKDMDGYVEFVPVKQGENPLGPNKFGEIKIKILKIKKGTTYNYSCSTELQKSDNSPVPPPELSAPKHSFLHIKREGLCGGSGLVPMQGNFPDTEAENTVGWKAKTAVVENSNIGIGAYICPNSTIKNSEVAGGLGGIAEVVDSNITEGARIFGNYFIEYSKIENAELDNSSTSLVWSPESKPVNVSYADILDLTDSAVISGNVPPILIYGNVNFWGTIDKRAKVEMTQSPSNAGQNLINGPQLLGFVQPIAVYGGSTIRNSLLGSTDPSLYANIPISISEKSIVDQSFIFGNVSLSEGARIESSQVGAYPEKSVIISARKPASKSSIFSTESSDPELMKISVVGSSIGSNSNITGYGTIVGNEVKITNSQVYDSMNISGRTIVDRSTIKSSTISDATIESESHVEDSNISEESTVSSSDVFSGTLLNKAKIIDSGNVRGTINDSEVTNNSGISDSNIINKSKINGSAVTLGSTIDNSEVLSNSNISSSMVSDKSHIYNSRVALSSTVIDSTLNENSGVSQSKAISSIVTGSEVVKSGTVVNVTLTNGSIVDGSTVTNCPNIEHSRITEVSEVVDSALTGSEIQKSTIKNSTVVDSFVRLSQVIEGSIVRNSSSISESIVKRQSILNSAGLAGTTSDHSIVHSSSVHLSSAKDSSITNSNLVNSTLDIGFTNSIYGSELTITDSTLNPYLYGLIKKAFFQQTCNERYNATTVNYDYVCVSGNGPSIP